MGFFGAICDLNAELGATNHIKRILIEMEDGTVMETSDPKLLDYIENFLPTDLYSIYKSDVMLENRNAETEIRDLLHGCKETGEVMSQLVDMDEGPYYTITELGSKLLRQINPDEDKVARLYKSIKNIEGSVKGFHPAKLLALDDVEGDEATIVASMLKESVQNDNSVNKTNSVSKTIVASMLKESVQNDNSVNKYVKKFLSPIFDGYATKPRDQVLKLISLLVTISDVFEKGFFEKGY